METPSVTRRVTRSQTSAASRSIPNSRKKEATEMGLSRTRKEKFDHRSALFDITNESPIVGIASGGLGTPSSVAKKSVQAKQTPGSGETILRNQVKTLLHKVEEEDDVSKLSLIARRVHQFQGLSRSPMALLAPTPTNTPIIPNLSNSGDGMVMGVDGQNCKNTQAADDVVKDEILDPCENLITRALLFESPGKSETSDSSMSSSVVTTQEGCSKEILLEEDKASVWSVQVPTTSKGGDDEEEESDYEDGYGDEEEGEVIDELCDGLRKISVGVKKEMPKFQGRHTRFVYNSDDEIDGEEDVEAEACSVSPSILRLKGVPTPAGKHLRFSAEEAEEDI